MRVRCSFPHALGARDGQAMIESCIAIMVIGLVFAGLMQISQIFAAREVLQHAAARGARAKTVGFNQWMIHKVVRVAAIPNAGKMTQPVFQNDDTTLKGYVTTLKPGALWETVLGVVPSSLQYNIERARIPSYLDGVNYPTASYILDYDDWNTVDYRVDTGSIGEGFDAPITVGTSQDYELWVPMHQAFYAADSVKLSGESQIENHYQLYLDDMGW